MTKILHLVLNDYENDNRVRRAAECGHETGAEVYIYALSKYDISKYFNHSGVYIRLFYLISRSWPKKYLIQAIKYLEMVVRMIISGVKFNPSLVHAHDLNALPIGFCIAKLTGAKLIYDSHEYWADAGALGSSNSIISKVVAKFEKYFIRRVNASITVSESIAEMLKKDYNIPKPFVVRNVPEKWNLNISKQLRTNLGISRGTIIILYQGIINGEGVFDLINAFERTSQNAVLVYLGNGEAVEKLKEMNVNGVYFHPSVSYTDLPSFTADADIGVHSMHGNLKNRLYALPNKLFEYIQGELSLIVSDLPEMAKVVSDCKLGLVYPNGDIEKLTYCLNKIISDEKFRKQTHSASAYFATKFNWEEEKKVLKNIYYSLLPDLV